ncbi:MAG: nucleotidyltransferase family protein [Pseudomonadales bacterium]
MIGGLILAAGSSRRFGEDKRKTTLPSGRWVLEEVIHTVAAELEQVIVVLRFGDKVFEDELSAKVDNDKIHYFRAPDSARGMAHSLGNAIHEIADWDAALIFLGDMPFVQRDTITSLMDNYTAHKTEAPIVVPAIKDTRGHPVLFDRLYFPEIEALTGDTGARELVQHHAEKVIQVDVDDPGILKDIDTPEDISA